MTLTTSLTKILAFGLMLRVNVLAFPKAYNSSNLFARQDVCSGHGPTIATFYTSGTSPTQTTACGNTYDPNSMTVAICTQIDNRESSFMPQRQYNLLRPRTP